MSNSIGHNFLHQSLLAPTVLEHQSKINSPCIASNTLFQAQANSQLRKSPINTKFKGSSLTNVRKTKLVMGTNRAVSDFPTAVLATDSEVFFQIIALLLFSYSLFGSMFSSK